MSKHTEQFMDWSEAVEIVAGSNGFTESQVIPTWPETQAGFAYPELTVGAVMAAKEATHNHAKLVEALRACIDELARHNIESGAAQGSCQLLQDIGEDV